MGCALRKHLRPEPGEDPVALKQAIRQLEAEVQQLRKERKIEERARRKELAMKQQEWNEEKNRLQEELRATLTNWSEKQYGREGMMMQLLEFKGNNWSHILVQQMKEQKQRDEAVEKWKRLYLSIKNELDQLIQATALISHPQAQGEQMLCTEWLKEELKAKEVINKELKAKLVEMEKESANLEREVDILRQSLRIMSTNRIKQ